MKRLNKFKLNMKWSSILFGENSLCCITACPCTLQSIVHTALAHTDTFPFKLLCWQIHFVCLYAVVIGSTVTLRQELTLVIPVSSVHKQNQNRYYTIKYILCPQLLSFKMHPALLVLTVAWIKVYTMLFRALG